MNVKFVHLLVAGIVGGASACGESASPIIEPALTLRIGIDGSTACNATTPSLDSARIVVRGLETGLTDLTRILMAGQTDTIGDLIPGGYDIYAEGFEENEMAWFDKIADRQVVEGDTSVVDLVLESFLPCVSSIFFPNPLEFMATFGSVAGAIEYLVDWSNDSAFATAEVVPITDTVVVVSVSEPGQYFVRARAKNELATLGGAGDSRQISVGGPATQLVVTTDPMSSTALNPIVPALRVSALDDLGNVATSFSDRVFVSITTGTGTPGATLGGGTDVAASTGTAVFSDLTISMVATDYTLDVTSGSLPTAVTASFDVSWMLWSADMTPTTENLQEVWGRSDFDVFAAGNPGMFHLESGVWVQQFTGVAGGFRALAGDTATPDSSPVVYAGTGSNLGPAPLVIYDGDSWSPVPGWMPINGSAVRSAWVGPTTVVIGGNASSTSPFTPGRIWHLENENWTSRWSGLDSTSILGLWGASDSDVFAVGQKETLLHYDGASWQIEWPPTTDSSLNSVWGSSGDDVWAVGHNGMLLHYNGITWTEFDSGVSESLNEIWGTAADDIFVAGLNGTILHFDGTQWAPEPTGTVTGFGGIWVSPTAKVAFAVGADGLILRGVR